MLSFVKAHVFVRTRPGRTIALILFFILVLTGLYHHYKHMPANLNASGPACPVDADRIEFLYDLTYRNPENLPVREQEIFDTILKRIDTARKYILIDMFLFNPWLGRAAGSYRRLSSELTDALVAQKAKFPELNIDFITDPINTVYGGSRSVELERLRRAGVHVIVTDLNPLRDSNPLYSTLWRLGPGWLGNSSRPGFLKHPFAETEAKVGLRSYLALLNFKANHRKVFLADRGPEYTCLLLSANPHDASSAHSNVAVEVGGGDLWQSVYVSEAGVAALSGDRLHVIEAPDGGGRAGPGAVSVRLVTERAVKDELLDVIGSTVSGDAIRLAMFYLSDRDVIGSLLAAAARGVSVKIILDPNKDAFGYTKNGIPNRPVASELVTGSQGKIRVRWYATGGEQFHSKLTLVGKGGKTHLILGSANLTRRNIANYNLEADLSIIADDGSGLAREAVDYFDRLWNNRDGNTFTLDYTAYADDSKTRYFVYRLQEASGLSSF
ncbi:MAG: phospholipase D-like domain-containing protein [Thermodesulfobacteriota bacterium]